MDGNVVGCLRRLRFKAGVGIDDGSSGARQRGRFLLDDVSELMRQQRAAVRGISIKPVAAQDDMSRDSVGIGVNRLCGGRRTGIGVDTHVAEVAAEPRLKERSGGFAKRLSGRMQGFLDKLRDRLCLTAPGRIALEQAVFVTGVAFVFGGRVIETC